ncbi:MAG: ABC transporter substrate-binding protein, partial [Elusimicrobiota bacterium]
PDLILTIGTSATKLVSEKIKDIPIIFSMIIDPEGVGLKSKNLTGSPLDIPIRLQFENLRTIIPKVRRIGVIYNPKENESIIQKAIETASDMGFVLKTYQVESTEDIQKIPKMEEMNIDVLWLVTDTIVCQLAIIKQILYSCLKNKIPVMGISSSYVKAGALLALSCDYEDIGRQSGEIAEKILNGKDLSTIQVSVPRKTKLYLNISVADRLGIKIPKEIIEKAEEVFGK